MDEEGGDTVVVVGGFPRPACESRGIYTRIYIKATLARLLPSPKVCHRRRCCSCIIWMTELARCWRLPLCPPSARDRKPVVSINTPCIFISRRTRERAHFYNILRKVRNSSRPIYIYSKYIQLFREYNTQRYIATLAAHFFIPRRS